MRLNPAARATTAISLCFATVAFACQDGYYEQCVDVGGLGVVKQCACLPNSGTVTATVTPANPFPDVLTIAGAAVKGNIATMSQAIGHLIIESQCPACKTIGEDIISKKDRALIEMVVGRGFLFYVTNGSPIALMGDLEHSSATEYVQSPPPVVQQPPPGRGTKTYLMSKASCIIQSTTNHVTAAFVSPHPKLTDSATGQSFDYPSVDLEPGDVLIVDADSCPEQTVANVQMSLTKVSMKYRYSNDLPSLSPTRWHLILTGDNV